MINGTSAVNKSARPSAAHSEIVSHLNLANKPACLSSQGNENPGYVKKGNGSDGRRRPGGDMGETSNLRPGKLETIYRDHWSAQIGTFFATQISWKVVGDKKYEPYPTRWVRCEFDIRSRGNVSTHSDSFPIPPIAKRQESDRSHEGPLRWGEHDWCYQRVCVNRDGPSSGYKWGGSGDTSDLGCQSVATTRIRSL